MATKHYSGVSPANRTCFCFRNAEWRFWGWRDVSGNLDENPSGDLVRVDENPSHLLVNSFKIDRCAYQLWF